MVAGKRVPAAYRKGNRRSHLTGDTVYRTGAILVPSGMRKSPKFRRFGPARLGAIGGVEALKAEVPNRNAQNAAQGPTQAQHAPPTNLQTLRLGTVEIMARKPRFGFD